VYASTQVTHQARSLEILREQTTPNSSPADQPKHVLRAYQRASSLKRVFQVTLHSLGEILQANLKTFKGAPFLMSWSFI
jgi:hypothetical protein